MHVDAEYVAGVSVGGWGLYIFAISPLVMFANVTPT